MNRTTNQVHGVSQEPRGYNPNESTCEPVSGSGHSLLDVVGATEESLRIIENKLDTLTAVLLCPMPQDPCSGEKDGYVSIATLSEKSYQTTNRIHEALDYLISRVERN